MIGSSDTRRKPGQGYIARSTLEGAAQRRVGLSLGRSKLVERAKDLRREHEGSGSIWSDDGSSSVPPLLFHRTERGVVVREGSGQGRFAPYLGCVAYRNVAFLNDEVVIASTEECLIDAVRLSDGIDSDADADVDADVDRPDQNSLQTDRLVPQSEVEAKGRRRQRPGKLIADQLGNPQTRGLNSGIKIQSLSNGQSFVTGMRSGDLRIFATERDSTWCRHRFQPSPITTTHGCGCTAYNDGTFLRTVLQMAPPLRRYRRTRGDDLPGLREIPDWDTNLLLSHTSNGPPFLRNRPRDFDESSWDFREIGSTLLAAHVHPEKDFLSLRTLDGNVRYEHGDGAKGDNRETTLTLGGTEALICLDESPRGYDEDITSVCFVGDWGIVTGHTAELMGSSLNRLTFYDRRFITEGHHRRKGDIAVTSRWFPQNEAVDMSPDMERCVVGHGSRQGATEVVEPADSQKMPLSQRNNRVAIVGLSAPFGDHSNSICVSLHGTEPYRHNQTLYSTEDLLLDAVSPSTIKQHVKLLSNAPSTLSQLPTFATDLTSMARYHCRTSKGRDGGTTDVEKVLLYDLSTVRVPESMHVNDYGDGRRRRVGKRRRDGHNVEDVDDNIDIEGGEAHGSCGALPLTLLDGDGLSSMATCIGFNDSGTSVVCGSADGDLFIY